MRQKKVPNIIVVTCAIIGGLSLVLIIGYAIIKSIFFN